MTGLSAYIFGADGAMLTWSLVHTLWQGVLITGLLVVILHAVPAAKANVRYGATLIALAVLAAAPVINYSFLTYESPAEQLHDAVAAVQITNEPETSAVNVPAEPETVSPGNRDSIAASNTSLDWTRWAVMGWLAGVLIMLTRLGRCHLGVVELRNNASPINDPRILALLDELKEQLGTSRRIAVLATERLVVPAVVGVLRPAILLPMSYVTQASPDVLRAVLAHELAHIRRYDFFVNVVQMVVEAFLFFNPFVWWISNRVRAEREACCDRFAANVTGSPVTYARILTGLADAAVPAMAVAACDNVHSLGDRVRRLLLPRYRPELQLPWPSLAALTALALVLLIVGGTGAFYVATFAARMLTPEERMAVMAGIEAEQEKKGGVDHEAEIIVTGRITTANGTPPENPIRASLIAQAPSLSTHYGMSVHEEGTYRITTHEGAAFVSARAEGYAHAVTEDFVIRGPGPVRAPDLVLQPAEPKTLDIRGTNGEPCTEAYIRVLYWQGGSGTSIFDGELEADEDGRFSIASLGDHEYGVYVRAPGFQEFDQRGFVFSPDEPAVVTLSAATPATIAVRDENGAPVPNAKLRLLSRTGADNHGYGDVQDGGVEIAPDDNGVFVVRFLRDHNRYHFALETPDGFKRMINDVSPGDDHVVTIGEPLSVAGTITGDLEALRDTAGQYRLHYSQAIKIDDTHFSHSESAPVQVENGVASFKLTALWPGRLQIQAGSIRHDLDLTEPVTGIELEIPEQVANAGERTVVCRVVPPEGLPPAQGAISVRIMTPDIRYFPQPERFELTDGEAHLTVPVGSKIKFEPGGMVGYWFPHWDTEIEKLPAGDDPYEYSIAVEPAGMIRCRVDAPAGSSVQDWRVRLRVDEDVEDFHSRVDVDIYNSQPASDATVTFSPLPFGRTYRLETNRNHTIAETETFQINERNPIVETTLTVPEGQNVVGAIVDRDGRPEVNVPVVLRYERDAGSTWRLLPVSTDQNGRFEFEAVNFDARGDYFVEVPSETHVVPMEQAVFAHTDDLRFEREPGIELEGVLIEKDTGWPVSNAKLSAYASRGGSALTYPSENTTGADGRFRFSNLRQGTYNVQVEGGGLVRQSFSTDEPQPVRLVLELFEHSDAKAVAPTK
jgi:beta-lactamase regulating signal transducer with metallopeptidase domain